LQSVAGFLCDCPFLEGTLSGLLIGLARTRLNPGDIIPFHHFGKALVVPLVMLLILFYFLFAYYFAK
jgi:hypothetical protein